MAPEIPPFPLGKFENVVHAHPYVLNGHELEHVFAEKYLGVTIDYDLKFEGHMAEKIGQLDSRIDSQKFLVP